MPPRSFTDAQHGRLEAAETEVPGISDERAGKADGVGRVSRHAFDDWAAGVAEAKQAGDLVKGFPCGIVPCFAQESILSVRLDQNDVRVPAGDDEGDGGQNGIASFFAVPLPIRNPVGVTMPLKVVDAIERKIPRHSQRLGKVDAHE